jgi:hypothetical protein
VARKRVIDDVDAHAERIAGPPGATPTPFLTSAAVYMLTAATVGVAIPEKEGIE